jgi:hypothetical protein
MKRVLQRLLLDLLLGIAHDLEHIDIDRQGLRKRMEIKPGAAKPGAGTKPAGARERRTEILSWYWLCSGSKELSEAGELCLPGYRSLS